jgi:hypothetical protein
VDVVGEVDRSRPGVMTAAPSGASTRRGVASTPNARPHQANENPLMSGHIPDFDRKAIEKTRGDRL